MSSTNSSQKGRQARIDQIVEACDRREYDKVIKLSRKARDIERLPLVKSIRALAHARMGQQAQAMELAAEVQATTPTDSRIIDTLLSVYRLTGDSHSAMELLKSAAEVDPENVDIQRKLYFSYAISGQIKQQQMRSMMLYKITKDPQYMMWAGLSLMLQGRKAQWDAIKSKSTHLPSNTNATSIHPVSQDDIKMISTLDSTAEKHFQLAKAMFERVLKNGELNHSEALGIYIQSLRQLNQNHEALKALQGDFHFVSELDTTNTSTQDAVPREFVPVEYAREELDLLFATKDWINAWRRAAQLLLQHDQDDWATLTALIEACLQYCQENEVYNTVSDQSMSDIVQVLRSTTDGKLSVTMPDQLDGIMPSVHSTHAVLLALQQIDIEKGGARKLSRGPFLAEIHLECRLLEADKYHTSLQHAHDIAGTQTTVNISERANFIHLRLSRFTESSADRLFPFDLLASYHDRYIELFGGTLCCFADLAPTMLLFADDTILMEDREAWFKHPPAAESVLRPGCTKYSPIHTPFSPVRFFGFSGYGKTGFFPNAEPQKKDTEQKPCAFGYNGIFSIRAPKEASEMFHSEILGTWSTNALNVITSTELEVSSVPQRFKNHNEALSTYICTQQAVQWFAQLHSPDPKSMRGSIRKYATLWSMITSPKTKDETTIIEGDSEKVATSDAHPADELLVLALEMLEQLSLMSDENVQDMLKALILVTIGQSRSPNNYYFKLLLLKFNGVIANMDPFADCFDALSIKHIQWDTLGYLILQPVLRVGHIDYADTLSQQMIRLYREDERENPAFCQRATEHRNYSTVLDLQRMRERMQYSIQNAEAKSILGTLNLPLQNLSSAHQYLRAVVIAGEYPDLINDMNNEDMHALLVDNRDFEFVANRDNEPINPVSIQVKQSIMRRSYTIITTQLRTALMHCAVWALEGNSRVLTERLNDLKSLVGSFGTLMRETPHIPELLHGIRISYYTADTNCSWCFQSWHVELERWNILIDLIQACKYVCDNHNMQLEQMGTSLNAAVNKLQSSFESLQTSVKNENEASSATFKSNIIMQVHNLPAVWNGIADFVQKFRFGVLFLGICAKALPKKVKSKKSKVKTSAISSTHGDNARTALKSVLQIYTKLNQLVRKLGSAQWAEIDTNKHQVENEVIGWITGHDKLVSEGDKALPATISSVFNKTKDSNKMLSEQLNKQLQQQISLLSSFKV